MFHSAKTQKRILGLNRIQWAVRFEIVRTLVEAQNVTAAARLLGCARASVNRYIKQLKIEHSEWKRSARFVRIAVLQ